MANTERREMRIAIIFRIGIKYNIHVTCIDVYSCEYFGDEDDGDDSDDTEMKCKYMCRCCRFIFYFFHFCNVIVAVAVDVV